jgi:hypothetical protein
MDKQNKLTPIPQGTRIYITAKAKKALYHLKAHTNKTLQELTQEAILEKLHRLEAETISISTTTPPPDAVRSYAVTEDE